MDREIRSLAVVARYGTAFVGLAVAIFGVIQGGVGAAQYYFKADLGTGIGIANTSAVKDGAFHDMAVGAAAVLIGALVGLFGLSRARRGLAAAEREAMWRSEAPGTLAVTPVIERTIDLDQNPTLEPIPAPVTDQLAPFATRVWQCKLAVDLQNQRLRTEGLGAEGRIDAELFVLALRSLVQAVKAAQSTTRSMHIWQAITDFGRVAGDPDEFIARLEQAATGTEPVEVGVEFQPSGTVVRLAAFTVPVEAMTRAAHQLATTTIGDLSGIRSRTSRAAAKPAHISAH